ncbi:hypothetical protein GCM10010466_51480 [Planomonospora alba]|uniref:Uncharacterized protein n=1 Tax=Planomonospora alba TaxID=161354 RepID=A0ABP6NQQ0_9ACTN
MRKWIAVAAAAVLAAGGAASWWLLREPDGVRPATVRSELNTAHYDPIATRALDPEPLTAAEIFPGDRVSSEQAVLTGARPESLADCASAVWGSAEAAVAGCTQALRAGYTSADGRTAGQFVIFNLPDSAAADRLVTALSRDGFVRPAAGLPEAFDGARGWAQARALGHYVTVSWVAPVGGGRVDLTHPQLAVDGLSLAIQRRLV